MKATDLIFGITISFFLDRQKLLFKMSVKGCFPFLTTHMSGSPIIQNGKLIGAVTHVLINDPTTGYGIFIENMLNQMGDLAG